MNTTTPSTELEMGRLAEELVLRHGANGRVDPERIAELEGLTLVNSPFLENIDGLLVDEGDRRVIVCNSRMAPRGSTRWRYTVAHQLGHHFARKMGLAGQDDALRIRGVGHGERPADAFAGHLLMPTEVFLREHDAMTVTGLMRIWELAKVFGTSLTSTAYRALDLDCFEPPAAVIVWDAMGRRCGRRLSTGTYFLMPDCVELVERPPEGSVTEKAVRSLGMGLRVGESDRRDWFPRLEDWGRVEGKLVREEVLSRAGYGWITLLEGNS
jgi:hypothetical protein